MFGLVVVLGGTKSATICTIASLYFLYLGTQEFWDFTLSHIPRNKHNRVCMTEFRFVYQLRLVPVGRTIPLISDTCGSHILQSKERSVFTFHWT